jgi:hypothetical protein
MGQPTEGDLKMVLTENRKQFTMAAKFKTIIFAQMMLGCKVCKLGCILVECGLGGWVDVPEQRIVPRVKLVGYWLARGKIKTRIGLF